MYSHSLGVFKSRLHSVCSSVPFTLHPLTPAKGRVKKKIVKIGFNSRSFWITRAELMIEVTLSELITFLPLNQLS